MSVAHPRNMKMALSWAGRRLVDVVITWYRESAIEYDVGALRHPAVLP
jgi:hypothetical protein